MNQAKLQKACKDRGLSEKGSKDDLLARLRDAFKMESETQSAPQTAEPAKKDTKSKKDPKSKESEKSSKTKSSSGSSVTSGSKILSAESIMISEFIDKIQLVRQWRSEEPDMIKKQLTEMSHLLPPLSPFSSNFKLDDWQKTVLQHIDDEKSVLICAPTSSGKTVLSSYVASKGRTTRQASEATKKVNTNNQEDSDSGGEDEPVIENGTSILFVVPSDPLVWQVGAHFAKWRGLDRNVALITDRLSYIPNAQHGKPAAVVVGTPLALETALTKIRGQMSFFDDKNKADVSQLSGGFDHYKWVVYDEVHSIGADTPDGLALQRLIKALKCKFLALSATVGNAQQLKTWMEKVKGEQINAELVNVEKEAVEIEVHEGRFINLQRHIFTKSDFDQYELKTLHPLSSVTLSFLKQGGFGNTSLPMTPQDSFSLWMSLTKYFEINAISELDPHKFFGSNERITLMKAKDYEVLIKSGLQKLALSHPVETENLLSSYNIEDLSPNFSIYDLVQSLKDKDNSGNDKLPCIIFHLDITHLIGRFHELLFGLESNQRKTHPTYYASLEGRRKMNMAEREAALKACATEEEKEELEKENDALGTVDLEQPHPDFVLKVRSPISRLEFDEICKDVAENDFRRDLVKARRHPLLRALRRGIGLYIDEVTFQAYKRVVMRLATKGKLAVVFSDESLAFGVNMPFRTCVFCGDMGGKLNSIFVQQMSGRAGRRGLDTQGHIVFAGAKSQFIRDMVLSRIPAIKGCDPRYFTLFLPTMCSRFSNPPGFPQQMDVIGKNPLCESIDPTLDYNMNQLSKELLLELKLIEECDIMTGDDLDQFDYSVDGFAQNPSSSPSGYRPRHPYNPVVMWMIWDLRDHVAESILSATLLPLLFQDFAAPPKTANYGDSEEVQFEFISTILHIVDRRPALPDSMILDENVFITSTTVVKREQLRTRIAKIEDHIVEHNANIRKINSTGNFPNLLKLIIPVENSPLDGELLHCFITGHTNDIHYSRQHEIKQRLWDLGCFLKSMHNALFLDTNRYGKLELLTRKCFMRIQYISSDHIRDAIDFINVSSYELEGEDVTQITSTIEQRIKNSLTVASNSI